MPGMFSGGRRDGVITKYWVEACMYFGAVGTMYMQIVLDEKPVCRTLISMCGFVLLLC